MIDDNEDYAQSTLKEILDSEELVLQEMLTIPNIHTKIKINMKIFIQYCIQHPTFTEKFINIGLKCPMHQSNNAQMKNFTFIAADVLTSDHQTLADLFIQKYISKEESTEEEIQEEIQTQGTMQGPIAERYAYLLSLFQYLGSEELDQNCVNYITKTMATLVRKKISLFLQFFIDNPNFLSRLIHLSYHPSVAHLLAKMLTDDDDSLTFKAQSVKEKIIPLLLDKIHQKTGQPSTASIFEGVEDILNATRYSDNQERSSLQIMSDEMVSQKQVALFLKSYLDSLETKQKNAQSFCSLQNSSTYLSLLLTRMNMDEQHDYTYSNVPQQFTPTLNYQLELLFKSFCKMVTSFHKIWQYKKMGNALFNMMVVKTLQPLVLMTKHTKFGDYYQKIDKKERTQALQSFLKLFCTINLNGILWQTISTLFQKMLTQEQKLSSLQQQIVSPGELYIAIAEYAGAIGSGITVLLQQNRKQRNMNEKGIYFRKILLLLENYFKYADVLKRYPDTAKLQTLFPPFNAHNNHLYAQKTIILDHPGGEKAMPVEEFKFIQRSRELMKNQSPMLEHYPGYQAEQENKLEKKVSETPVTVSVEQKEEKPSQLTFRLNDKINDRKNRVKQTNTDKDQSDRQCPMPPASPTSHEPPLPSSQNQPPATSSSSSESPKPKRDSPSQSPQGSPQGSPCKARGATGLTFFIRHLVIY